LVLGDVGIGVDFFHLMPEVRELLAVVERGIQKYLYRVFMALAANFALKSSFKLESNVDVTLLQDRSKGPSITRLLAVVIKRVL
jgi:hypothetical protein